jgi:hypothetical protein
MQAVTADPPHDSRTGGFRIAALRGAPTPEIQKLLAGFADRRRREGLRVAGVIEVPTVAPDGAAVSVVLRDIGNGSTFPVFQNLGRESTACSLDSSGLAAACQSVLRAISGGADLIVLSKFGKLEEAGSGLLHAFGAAADAGIPCVTGVAPNFAGPFMDFAGNYAQWVSAGESALEAWWASPGEDSAIA